MASAAQKLGRRRNRGMGLPKGEDVTQQADQLSQSANRSSPNTNGDSTEARRQPARKRGSQASDSNLQESLGEIGSDRNSSTCGPSQDNCAQATPRKAKGKAHTPSTAKGQRKQPVKSPKARTPTKTKTSKAVPATPKASTKKQSSMPLPQATSTPMAKNTTGLEVASSLDTSEVTPGGRPKRRAAKAAIEYLHNIVKSLNGGNADDQKRDDDEDMDMDVDAESSSTKTPKKQATAQRKKRKAPEPDSDLAEDSDFVPEEKEDDSDEVMDEDEDLDEEFTHRERKVTPIFQKNSNFSSAFPVRRPGLASNGLSNRLMYPVWTAFPAHKELGSYQRLQHRQAIHQYIVFL